MEYAKSSKGPLSRSRYLAWVIQHPLILIFLIAFVLRAAPNIWLEWQQPGWHARNINEMEFYYDDVARSLIAGKGFVHSVNPRSQDSPYNFSPGTPFHFVPPLYAWLLGFEYFLFGPNILVAKLVQSALDASVCVLLYKVGIVTTNHKTSLIAAFLYSIYPLAIYTSSRLYYQIPMNLALCWIVLCMAAPVNAKNGIWTGMAVSISALAKPVTLPFLLIIPIIWIFENFRDKIAFKFSLLASFSFVMTALLILTPWTIRNYMVFHRFIPIQDGADAALFQGSKEGYIDMDVKSLHIKYGQSFGLKPDQFAAAAVDNHLQHLRDAPFDYFRFLGKKFLLAWFNTEGKGKNLLTLLIQIPFLALAVFGLVKYIKFWLKKPNWYIPALILYICGIQVVIFPLARYTLAVMPLVMLMAAFSLVKIMEWWTGTSPV